MKIAGWSQHNKRIFMISSPLSFLPGPAPIPDVPEELVSQLQAASLTQAAPDLPLPQV